MVSNVSIIMAVYNELEYVDLTIKSILSQSYIDFEFIIIVDTNDQTIIDRVLSFSDPRLRVFKNAKNIGLTKSLNFAIKQASGNYIARIDADDIAHIDRLSKQIQFLEDNPSIDVLGSNANIVNSLGEKIGMIKLNQNNSDITRGLLFKNQLIHPSVVVRKAVFERFGLYNECLKRSQDYEFWLRIRKKVQFHNLKENLLDYRIHSRSVTQSSNIEQRTTGIEMMYKYLIINKSDLSTAERFLIILFFLKQFFKILRSTF